jgi:hypothetical protein
VTPSRDDDAEAGAQHAVDAESFLGGAGGAPGELMLAFVMSAAAHAALAVYYELRAQQ